MFVVETSQTSGFYSLKGKRSTCSEECFSLARLNLICQSCVVLRETFVQLGKSFRGGAPTKKRRYTSPGGFFFGGGVRHDDNYVRTTLK